MVSKFSLHWALDCNFGLNVRILICEFYFVYTCSQMTFL